MKIWKTITLGIGPHDCVEVHSALKKRNPEMFLCNDWLQYLIHRCNYSGEPVEIDLVLVSGNELGIYKEYLSLHEIYTAAEKQNLEMCPPSLCPQLFLQSEDACFKGEGRGEHIYIGMKPLVGLYGGLSIFGIITAWTKAAYHPPKLGSMIADCFTSYPSKCKWVFVKPRK